MIAQSVEPLGEKSRAASEGPLSGNIQVCVKLEPHHGTMLNHAFPKAAPAKSPGSAEQDLRAFANRGSLPIGVVALRQGTACGVAALKSESIASHRQLLPWAAAGLVAPSERGKGIGSLLLGALEREARELGYPFIYCGTSTAESLLERRQWQLMERIVHEGQGLGIYRKAL